MDFWEDVLQVEADEITRKLEQWACMIGRSTLYFLSYVLSWYVG